MNKKKHTKSSYLYKNMRNIPIFFFYIKDKERERDEHVEM